MTIQKMNSYMAAQNYQPSGVSPEKVSRTEIVQKRFRRGLSQSAADA
jgi:hypothetical protein